jgi:very-short-patch-repair endonuclease
VTYDLGSLVGILVANGEQNKMQEDDASVDTGARPGRNSPLKTDNDNGREPTQVPADEALNPISQDFLKGSAAAGIERIRARLLDLTNRNKLLNFRHSARSMLRVVGALPNVIFQCITDGDTLTFRPVPEPGNIEAMRISARDRAQQLGIPSSFDLPLSIGATSTVRGRAAPLQTIHYPSDLESISRRISYAARTAIEESGTNTLYLIFGFLEWYESDVSLEPHLAPLLVVPVTINRGKPDPASGTFSYEIAYSGEEIEPNLCLREKLKRDFGLELPDFSEDDVPEAYFSKFQALLKSKARWQLRRQLTLALLYFGKLRMYRDLDPRVWPGQQGLIEHRLIKDLFEGTKRTDRIISEEYEIDSSAIAKQVPPLILDADSSQLSALIDALQGKNLVVEGPPGTGKSQTISNLIAIALAEGKTVLFVSEKLAALEVVRRRLDNSGLGIFCLELHSHRTEKRKLLDDLENRVNALESFADPRGLDGKIRLQEQAKRQLLEYIEQINASSGPLGRSVFDVIWARERYRQELRFDPLFVEGVTILNSGRMGSADFALDCQRLEIYGRHLASVVRGRDSMRAHPWYGVTNIRLDYPAQQQLVAKLKQLSQAARSLDEVVAALDPTIGFQIEADPDAIARLLELRKEIPEHDETAPPELLASLVNEKARNSAASFAQQLAAWRKEDRTLHDHFSEILRVDAEVFERSLILCRSAEEAGLGTLALGELRERATVAQDLASQVERIIPFFRESVRILATEITSEIQALANLAATCRLLDRTPVELLSMRQVSLEGEDAASLVIQAEREAASLRAERARISQLLTWDASLVAEDLERHAGVLERTRYIGRFRANYRHAREYFRRLSIRPGRRSRREMASTLLELGSLLDRINSFETRSPYSSLLGNRFGGVDTDFESLGRLVKWYAEVRQALWMSGGSGSAFTNAIFRTSAERLQRLRALIAARADVLCELETFAVGGLIQVAETLPNSLVRACDDQIEEIAVHLRRMAELGPNIVDALTALRVREDCRIADVAGALSRLKNHQQKQTELEEHPARVVCGRIFDGVRTDLMPIEASLNVLWQIGAARLPSAVKQWLLQDNVAQRIQYLRQRFELLEERLNAFREASGSFCQQATLAYSQWYGGISDGLRLINIQARCDRALAEIETLLAWLDFLRAREQVEQANLQELSNLAEAGSIQVDDLIPAYRVAFYNSLTVSIFEHRPELLRFTGLTQEAIREEFIRYDKEIINLNRQRLARRIDRLPPPGNGSGPVSQWTDLALIKNEISKKKRHISIRQLMRRAANALQSLKPCFMMSPLSVAQYLAPGQLAFDLVVMDEASQLKPEDALGAVARGSQLIVVGDPKQLPPSTFFERRLEGDEDEAADDELLSVEEHESILDVASALYQPIRQLRWHYRSRHASLIAFSNREFYRGRLLLFPSPFPDRADLGVRFRYVEDGLYEERRNRPEAERVANAIINHIKTQPEHSLGVVALNFEQRELIEELLTQRARQDEVCQRYLEQQQHVAEPFFIKNLENVQGDERDTIFISVTYGRDAKRNLFQRFGPINQAQGARRLNVLFTRAKERVLVFSSIDPDELRVDSASPQGVRILKAYLTYAKTGQLDTAQYGRLEAANDFEIAAGNALRELGFDIEHQIGVAGFSIDIGIRHPKKPGAFVLGVECDGATYHSVRSIRDRDRLRQTILENLGWNIHRIWSTDWFKDRKRETEKIVARVQEILRAESLSNTNAA